jgi:hypothetical protein
MAGRRTISWLWGLREILRGACPEENEGLRIKMLSFRMETI